MWMIPDTRLQARGDTYCAWTAGNRSSLCWTLGLSEVIPLDAKTILLTPTMLAWSKLSLGHPGSVPWSTVSQGISSKTFVSNHYGSPVTQGPLVMRGPTTWRMCLVMQERPPCYQHCEIAQKDNSGGAFQTVVHASRESTAREHCFWTRKRLRCLDGT